MIDPDFQEVRRLFVLSFADVAQITSEKRHFIPTVKVKDNSVMIDWKNGFNKPIKNDIKT